MDRRALAPFLPTALLAAALLAGCSDPAAVPASPDEADVAPQAMSIAGLVQDATFAPIAGANVTLRFTEHAQRTDAGGRFRFDGLVPSPYLVDVEAPGYENASLTAEPTQGPAAESLEFVLQVPASLRPTNFTVQFHGTLECALEAFIITPSCDSLLTDPRVGGPQVFQAISNFMHDVGPRWRTVVVDVDFDPSAHPGMAGMRITTRGHGDANSTGDYDAFGQFHGAGPFTFRLEPGQSYEGGDVPVPVNATALRFEAFPQSHGWHPAGQKLLGVGVARNVVFDLYVTTFYNEPAPEGWSFFGQPA